MRFKEGVQARRIANGKAITVQPVIWEMLYSVDDVFIKETGQEVTVTSLVDNDPKKPHRDDSKHHEGLAADIRTKHLSEAMKRGLVVVLKRALGEDFDVVAEPTHIHLEFDQK